MKKIISVKDVEALLRQGKSTEAITVDAILTPSARDLLKSSEFGKAASARTATGASHSSGSISANSSQSDLDSFFHTEEMESLKEQICDVGRRMWQRAYVDGNGGNIAIRVADDLALCTPTLVSKGFMKPSDLCMVDLDGNQKAGKKKRTSEILMHLEIMKRQPKAKATAHCHPPHATAYAVAGVEPPTCMIPEIEVFIGKVPIAPYRTPGTPEMGKLVADLVDKHNTVLMGNHGAVSWSHLTVEDAYFKMEILEAYCRTIWVASQLGTPLKTMNPEQLKDLLNIKQTLGIPDPRFGLKECELCDNEEWRPGVMCAVPSKEEEASAPRDEHVESTVRAITDQVMAQLSTK
ncbi:MAG: class II aldolase/adducin family protein [Verrucomicrobiota bacterium]|jgi:L-fuculose-phosphate aldolase|nr:class II aldolase/adducin family protein [Verrucomicrobiota bacterium]